MVGINGTIELNDDSKKTLNTMENTNKSMLITGKAGTGKTTLLTKFVEQTKKNVVVVAPTGIAAMNIGGQTIHSFFMFPPKMLDEYDVKKVYRDIYTKVDMIIIDEISMVRADLLDAIDLFMRLNGRDSSKPFGGVQMVFFGDLYQLPPVVENEMGAVMQKIYKSPYFFDAKVMNHLPLEIINLTKVYRQTDLRFIELLDKVRLGNIDAVALELINAKASESKSKDSDCGNGEVCQKIGSPTNWYCVSTAGVEIQSPRLCTENMFYNDNNCIDKCIGGQIQTLKCCGENSVILFDEGIIAMVEYREYGGYYCSSSNAPCLRDIDCNTDNFCDSTAHLCRSVVLLKTCGDNKIQYPEQCDDGNTISGDGCSYTCQLESTSNETNYTGVIVGSIIGVCIIIGFIILAFVLKKKKDVV